MKKYFIIFLIFFNNENLQASIKENIIENLKKTNNLSFSFEQNINKKREKGTCTIEYPKKMFCKYDTENSKILVSNGRYLVIKTNRSHYIYPIKKTVLNYILDKDYLLEKISIAELKGINDKFIYFRIVQNDNEIDLFFNKNDHNLVGWQSLDIYQNVNITYISEITRNQKLKEGLFILPKQN
tara:strand:- start:4 stop:552 length:549 start_codon:yes stop_codon:yes gene_type:complete